MMSGRTSAFGVKHLSKDKENACCKGATSSENQETKLKKNQASALLMHARNYRKQQDHISHNSQRQGKNQI